MTAIEDPFLSTLQALWEQDSASLRSGADWGALGADPAGLDPYTLEAVELLEPVPARRWRQTARPEQIPPPGRWLYWVLCAGRGFGKSFVGSNVLVEWALTESGDYAAVGPTFSDARKIMTEGESGLLAAAGDDLESYNKSEFILYLRNGSRIILASGDAPDRLRGLNLRGAWLDELASFADSRHLWDYVLLPALRIGDLPRTVITTTPRRGSPVLTELLDRAKNDDPDVVVTRGSTFDNTANLSAAFLTAMEKRYAGTTIGLQELSGELLQEVPGALWSMDLIERTRVAAAQCPEFDRIVVAVDPAVSNNEGSDHTGIVVVGIGPAPAGWTPPEGRLALVGAPHVYVLEDASVKASAESWCRRALEISDEWDADALVAEINQGGDLVKSTLSLVASADGAEMPYLRQVHASRGKKARAEPVAGLFEQGRAHFVGQHNLLEDELVTWNPLDSIKSPDRLDALCWGAVELIPELALKGPSAVRLLSS